MTTWDPNKPLRYNLLDDSDSYKDPHEFLYHPDVEAIYSYFESRGGVYPELMMFGPQSYVRFICENPLTKLDIEEEEDFCRGHGTAFHRQGWLDILDKFGGHYPVQIKSLDEGLIVPTRTPMVTVQSKRSYRFVTSYLETNFLAHQWPSITVATRIFGMKRKLVPFYAETSDSGKVDDFAILNFGARGSKGREDVRITGAAHLGMFKGSDSKLAVRFTNHYYDSPMSGFSVWATEHSVMCSWGEDGVSVLRALLHAAIAKGAKILSIVGDTWNIFKFCEAAASMAREFQEAGVVLVVRPDSGGMEQVLHAIIPILANGFGVTTNRKGFYVLNGCKVLWADGIDEDTVVAPWVVARELRFSADNMMAGSGGGLVQKSLDRDTCKFAFKASAMLYRGSDQWVGTAKDPITDQGKSSKKGRFAVIDLPMGYTTMPLQEDNEIQARNNLLKLRYDTGEAFNHDTIDNIRERIDAAVYAVRSRQEQARHIQAEHHR